MIRNLGDGGRMGSGGGGSGSGGSPPSKNHQDGVRSRSTVGKRSEKSDAKKAAAPCAASFGSGVGGGAISIRRDKPTESRVHHQSDHHHLTSPAAEAETHNGKGSGEVVEWPRIYIALSRKEKEDDIFTMKGTKLPHRPKKRAKAIDRALQYCFPGIWLSDLSRARYEVRERKSVKKQPRRWGLKGLESMESESD